MKEKEHYISCKIDGDNKMYKIYTSDIIFADGSYYVSACDYLF